MERQWIVAAITTLAVGIGGFDVACIPPTFEADALAQLEDRGSCLALPSQM